jgi:hypothetical protein
MKRQTVAIKAILSNEKKKKEFNGIKDGSPQQERQSSRYEGRRQVNHQNS